jgi:hypothetical protein
VGPFEPFAEVGLETWREEDDLAAEGGDGVDSPRDALVFEVRIGFDIDRPIGRALGEFMTDERGELCGIHNLRANLEAAYGSPPVPGLACEDANPQWHDAGGGKEFHSGQHGADREAVGRPPWHWDCDSYDDAKRH